MMILQFLAVLAIIHQASSKKLLLAQAIWGPGHGIEDENPDWHENDLPSTSEISDKGIEEAWELGKFLSDRYQTLENPFNDTFKFINQTYKQWEVHFISIDDKRAIQSAYTTLASFYNNAHKKKGTPLLPEGWQPVPVHTRPRTQDPSLIVWRKCQASNRILDSAGIKSAETYKRLTNYDLRRYQGAALLHRIATLMEDKRDGIRLKLEREQGTSNDTNWDWAYYLNFVAYSTHEHTVLAVLAILTGGDVHKYTNGQMPGPSSCLLIELWNKSLGNDVIDVQYRHDAKASWTPVAIANCPGDCDYEDFYKIFGKYPTGWVEECDGTIMTQSNTHQAKTTQADTTQASTTNANTTVGSGKGKIMINSKMNVILVIICMLK